MTISACDFDSLVNLSVVQSGQTTDVGTDGQVSIPYASTLKWNVWKSIHFWNRSTNYENLVPLFERVFFSMHMRQGYLSPHVKASLKGLDVLKITHKEDSEAFSQLCKVSEFVQGKLGKWEKKLDQRLVSKPTPGDATYTDLEKSVLMSFLKTPLNIRLTWETGIHWMLRKIEAFTFAAEDLSKQDKMILKTIHGALENCSKWERIRQIWNDPELQKLTVGEMKNLMSRAIEEYLDSLNQCSEEVRQNIGFVIPFTMSYSKWDHVVTIGICQDSEGNYLLSQCNAGFGAQPEKYNFNFSYNHPMHAYGKTVVEYGPLDRKQVHAFLTEFARAHIYRDTLDQVKEAYQKLFSSLQAHVSNRKIPSRRLQASGNCTIKSPLEWALFCLQK